MGEHLLHHILGRMPVLEHPRGGRQQNAGREPVERFESGAVTHAHAGEQQLDLLMCSHETLDGVGKGRHPKGMGHRRPFGVSQCIADRSRPAKAVVPPGMGRPAGV